MKQFSKETRNKMRLAKLGKKQSLELVKKRVAKLIGQKRTEESRRRISESKIGILNGQWKGENVGYGSIHDYIKYHLPKVEICEECNIAQSYDLANISGEYSRNLKDWRWLCRKCHMVSDGRMTKLIERNKTKRGKKI